MAEFISFRPIALRPQLLLSLPLSIYTQYTRKKAPRHCNFITRTSIPSKKCYTGMNYPAASGRGICLKMLNTYAASGGVLDPLGNKKTNKLRKLI